MSARVSVLWKNNSIAFSAGNGQHQFFAKDNTIISDAGNIPDLATGPGVWHRIPMLGFDALRIFGDFITVDVGTHTTTSDTEIRPFALGYGPEPDDVPNLKENNSLIGKTVANVIAPTFAGMHSLTSYAWDIPSTTYKNHVRAVNAMNNSSPLLTGTVHQPIFLATSMGNLQRRRWYYDVGDHLPDITATVQISTVSNGVAAAASKINRNWQSGGPLALCSGFAYVYVAIKAYNNAAVAGAGNLIIAGQISAIRYRSASLSV